MAGLRKNEMIRQIGDEALKAKTGKTWEQWSSILDKAGAGTMDHTQTARWLSEKKKIPGWWCQMIAVGYEQMRGLREKHQRPDGYEISVSKTIEASTSSLYKAWKDASIRKHWLPDTPIVIHKATPLKSLRVTWTDGKKNVDVSFYPKNKKKCQVVVQHRMLPTAAAAARMKKFWATALNHLTVMIGLHQLLGKHYGK